MEGGVSTPPFNFCLAILFSLSMQGLQNILSLGKVLQSSKFPCQMTTVEQNRAHEERSGGKKPGGKKKNKNVASGEKISTALHSSFFCARRSADQRSISKWNRN